MGLMGHQFGGTNQPAQAGQVQSPAFDSFWPTDKTTSPRPRSPPPASWQVSVNLCKSGALRCRSGDKIAKHHRRSPLPRTVLLPRLWRHPPPYPSVATPPPPPRANPASSHRRKVVAAPAPVPGPPLVQPPTPAGGVPAADCPTPQPASTVGLPSAPTPLSKVAGNGDGPQ
jgi:hypothetical protein